MTQEDKQLLIKDICARLPYNVKLGFENSNVILIPKDYCYFTQQLFSTLAFPEHNGTVEYGYPLYNYRPYLRPMSSMTEEEKEELIRRFCYEWEEGIMDLYYSIEIKDFDCFIDWLNEHHFDYRGLIPMGLALEAKKGMYNGTNKA